MIDNAASGKSSNQINVWRFCYWAAVAALFIWATWQRFALPLDPIADPDTWGYLSPALRKLLGAEFGHTHGRNFVYPAFIFVLLRVFGDFRAIVVVQHLLGLFAGGILLLTWLRSRALVHDSRLRREVHIGMGLLATATLLVAGEPVRFYSRMCPAYSRDKSLNLTDGYRNGVTSLALQPYPDLWMKYLPAVQFMGRTELLARSAPSVQQSRPLRLTLSLLSRLYRPLLLATVVVGAVFLHRRKYRSRLGWLAVWVAFLYLWNWACCLEVAIIHSLEVRRYATVQVFFTNLAQFTALWFFCEIVFQNRVREASPAKVIE